jgi:hypothetical protein
MYSNRTTIWLPVLLWVLCPVSAFGGAPHIPCSNPFVFSDAAVNVVVLPYDDTAVSEATSHNSGTQLALLVQMDVLSHILAYGNVGAVQMEAPPGAGRDCSANVILAKLLGKDYGAQAQIRPGHGLVLVWGLMYEEDDDLYVQTYARFLRRDVGEEILFSAGGQKFTAKPTAQVITFAPRHLSKKDLDKISAAYIKSNIVHVMPNDASPGEELHGVARCGACSWDTRAIGFLVIGESGDWIHIVRQLPNRETREGWIHAKNDSDISFTVDRRLPELGFIEGSVGYLRSRFDAENKQSPPEQAGRLVAEQFTNFMELSDRDNETEAVAVAKQLSGIVHVLASKSYLQGLTEAQESFDQARQLVPYSPDAITLSVGTELNRAALVAATANQAIVINDPRVLAQRLAQASALAPASKEALGNLNSYYKAARNAEQRGTQANHLEKPEIERQIQKLDPRVMMFAPGQAERGSRTANPSAAPAINKRLDMQELKTNATAVQKNGKDE